MAERAVDDDLDPDWEPAHASGPGRHCRTQGPVIEVYADGAIDRPCPEPDCGAEPLSFCREPDGTQRKLPHFRR